MKIRETIKQARKDQGMTQKELCEGICSRLTLVNFENGKRGISAISLEKILDKLNLKIS